MRILKTIIYILIALVLVLVLLGFVGPKTYDVSRTTTINAPPSVVFPYLKSLKKQNEWGPWAKQDTNMQVTYTGEDGTVGFTSAWEGPLMGKGKQTISSIQGTTVETELTFYMPWGESKPTGYMHAADAANGSEVTWGIRGENDFIGRIFGVFMNADKSVGPMFEEGLASLKALIEGEVNKEYKGYRIATVEFPARQYVAVRGTVDMGDIPAFMGQHFPHISGELAKANLATDGAPSGLYYVWDEKNGTTEMAAGIPVKMPAAIPNTEVITIPAGKALLIDHYGAYEGLMNAHLAMDEYSQTTGSKTKAPVIEEYITDPQSEPDSTKWLTKVYYLLDQ